MYLSKISVPLFSLHDTGEEIPEPISIQVDSIDTFLKPDFWQTLEKFISSRICKAGQGEDDVREKKMKLLIRAMEDYPDYVGGKLPKGCYTMHLLS